MRTEAWLSAITVKVKIHDWPPSFLNSNRADYLNNKCSRKRCLSKIQLAFIVLNDSFYFPSQMKSTGRKYSSRLATADSTGAMWSASWSCRHQSLPFPLETAQPSPAQPSEPFPKEWSLNCICSHGYLVGQILIMCMWVWARKEAGRGQQPPWSWSCRQLAVSRLIRCWESGSFPQQVFLTAWPSL